MQKGTIFLTMLVFLSFILAIYSYQELPENYAIHWNAVGDADGFAEKGFGLFLLPAISLGILGLYFLIPRIDPLKANIEKFRKYYQLLFGVLLGFFVYLQIVIIAFNLSEGFNMNYAILPGIAAILFVSGYVMENSERNWFVGIKTPWTLSSEKVWKKTHALGAKLFKIASILILFSLLFSDYAMWIVRGAVLTAAIVPIIYSYLEYSKEMKKK
jgi:uncharacterized membrane protein